MNRRISFAVALSCVLAVSGTAEALRPGADAKLRAVAHSKVDGAESRLTATAQVELLGALAPTAAKAEKQHVTREARQQATKAAKSDFLSVKAAIAAAHPEGKRGNINHLIETLSRGQTVKVGRRQVGLKELTHAFESGYGQQLAAAVRGQAVDPETGRVGFSAHEWIPINLVPTVIGRSIEGGDLRWVHLQDEMRTATSSLIFSPAAVHETDKRGRWIPMGHDGAVYDISTREDSGSWKNGSPLIVGQADFHRELRAAFTEGSSPDKVIDGIEKVAKKWIWNGELDDSTEIAPGVANQGKQLRLHREEFKTLQAQRYRDLMKMLETMKAKYGKPPPAPDKKPSQGQTQRTSDAPSLRPAA